MTTSLPSERHTTLQARVPCGLASVRRKSLGLAKYSWKASLSKLATAATVLPSGETAQSITPFCGLDTSVTNLPLPQSLASAENGFFDVQRTIPNAVWFGLLPSAKIDLPSGAQRTVLTTLKSGSVMHCGACGSLRTCSRHRSWSLCEPSGLLSRNIAIRFLSTVGAHARSLNLSPASVSGSAVSSFFDRSLRKTRRLATYATFVPSAEK